jgi:hypothetical protein
MESAKYVRTTQATIVQLYLASPWSTATLARHLDPERTPHTFPGTRRPTVDGTAAPLAGHHAHDRLAVKARTEFRRHSRYPAWCLPRNLHYDGEPNAVHEITGGDHAEAG